MLTWIKHFLGNNNIEISHWKTDNSIYEFLRNNLDENGRLKDSANDLPDEKAINENEVRFAPGLLDSMFGARDTEESKDKIDDLLKLIIRIANYDDLKSKSKFYEIITEGEAVIGIIDDLLEKLINSSPQINPYLLEFSRDLMIHTGNRNSVKVGIALTGICQNHSLINEIKLIGLHDEFTLFAIVAISSMSENVVSDLWEIAKKVDGWGKIHTVERLTKMELPTDVKKWLITDGYKNSIMYEYLAYTCAINGDLQDVIIQETIDNTIFKSAGEIIEALITGRPAEDISQYQYASILISNYIKHAQIHSADIFDFNVLNGIKDYLTELQNDVEENSKNGWTQDIISNCLIDIVSVINKRDWTDLTVDALNSDDNLIFWSGKKAAKTLQIDIWNIVWPKLKKKPLESSLWYDVVHEAKDNNVDDVLQLAIDVLPLEDIATGPRDSLGLGAEFIKHQSLDYVITFLENYPTKGEPILLAALWSPVTRNRNMAIKVLQKWGRANWSESVLFRLQQLGEIEPNKSTKENILCVLRGEELSY